MAGKGRPKLDDKRDNQYRVRLNDQEDAMLDYSSRATGLPKSEIFRKALQDFYNNTLLNEYETKQQYEEVWEFDHISLKRVIKCPYCGEGNRIDFSDYIVNETSYERQMGAEIAYTFQCHDLECVSCGQKFFVDGSIHEYPLGSYESEQIEIRKIFSEKRSIVMDSAYVKNLVMTVIKYSESEYWEDAVTEWEIDDCEEDDSCSNECICGKENIKYLYTIRNVRNGNTLFPIGSSCIKKFNRTDMNEETVLRESTFKLLHAVEDNRYLSLSTELFSRKLLRWLYDQGAFDTPYNQYDGEEDYEFMLKMFNKRDKSTISVKQDKKIKAILLNSIKPFLQKTLEEKIR